MRRAHLAALGFFAFWMLVVSHYVLFNAPVPKHQAELRLLFSLPPLYSNSTFPFYHASKPGLQQAPSMPGPGRVLVVYANFEQNEKYDAKGNIEFFLRMGVDPLHDVDYVLVFIGPHTVQPPSYPNVLVIEKENEGFDLGAWAFALNNIQWRGDGKLWKGAHPERGQWDYFIFLNSAVRGPFRPSYLPDDIHWTTVYTEPIRRNPAGSPIGPVKLVGTTINCKFHPHVQSMLWVTDREGLEYLQTKGLPRPASSKDESILFEIGISRAIIENGWNIAAIASAFQGRDFRDHAQCNQNKDPYYGYYGIDIHLLETMFSKYLMPRKVEELYTRVALHNKFLPDNKPWWE